MTFDEHRKPCGGANYVDAAFWTALSFIFFRLCQYLVRFYIFGELKLGEFSLFGHRRNNLDLETDEEELPPKYRWRVSNEVISILHATISGMWAAYCILLNKDLDTCGSCIYLLFVTAGYLIYDFIDLIANECSCRIVELLFHHVVVICGFFVPLVFKKYMEIAMLGLLMELNSIVLHARSLCNLYKVDKRSLPFRIMAMINLITFVLFRLINSAYLCFWMVSQWWKVPFWEWFCLFFVIASLTVTNVILFYRVMQADGFFGQRRREPRRDGGELPTSKTDSDDSPPRPSLP